MIQIFFQRLKARFASWYINANLNEYVTNGDIAFLEFVCVMRYGFNAVKIDLYSYAFYTKKGVYVYSRCNGSIYFFGE